MIQKNYSSLLFLFFGLLYGNLSFGQNPVANNDSYIDYLPECQYLPNMILSNDTDATGLNVNTIDLDQSQPGIQNQVTLPNGTTFYNLNGDLTLSGSQASNIPNETVTLSYTVQNMLGNTSNVATVTILLKRLITYSTYTNPTCQNNDGTITIHNLGNTNGPCIIYLYKDNVEVANQTVSAQPTYTFSGLPGGHYSYKINIYCGMEADYQRSVGYLFYYPTISGTTTATYQDYNNDGIVNVGDTMSYQFNVTNTSATCTMYNVAIGNDYITPTNPTIPSLSPGATATLTGYLTITQDHINFGAVQFFPNIKVSNPGAFFLGYNIALTSTPLNVSNGIKLNAFIDTNNNGVQDNDEQNYTEGAFSYQINSGATHNVMTSTGTHYLYETNPANLYTLQYNINQNNTYCGSQYAVATPSYTGVAVANGSGIVTYNFAITTTPCNDIAVSLYPNGNPRPGFIYGNVIQYKNEGNQTLTNGTITFTKDDALTISSISEFGTMSTANGFTFDFYNLLPGESRNLSIVFQVPTVPTVNLGQAIVNNVSITPSDANNNNNNAALTQLISGSYDPNDKSENHGGKVLYSAFTANDYLTYTIRFENTGTAEAINIRVNDVLDAQLDETSIKMVASSHPYVLDRMGTNLNWRFDGINLPPAVSGDEVTGHAYIVFKIKPKAGYALGDVIPNKGDIYFDFNPAIETNICTTQFVSALANPIFDATAFEYYPNPTSGNVTFSLNNATPIDSVEVTDILGKTLLSKIIHYTSATIDLSSLAKGIYLAKVKVSGQEKVVKIVKE